jgi:hypothetical protein
LEEGTYSVYAFTEEEAHKIWKQTKPKEAYSENIQCENVPRKGFLGIGHKPGKWIIRWIIPCKARIAYKYSENAEIKVKYKERRLTTG